MRSPLFIFLRKKPCHTEIILFFTFWVTCAYFFPSRGSWNDNSRLNLTYCIVDFKTFVIEKYKNRLGYETEDTSLINGRLYSNKSPATSFIAIPSYIIFKKVAPLLGLNTEDPSLRRWWVVNTVASVAGGISASLMYRVVITYGLSNTLAAALATFFSMGTIHLGFSILYYPYSLVSMFLLLSFLMFRGVIWKRTAEGSGFFGWLLAGYFSGNAAFTEFPVSLIVAGFSVYAIYLMTLGLKGKKLFSISSPFYKRLLGYIVGIILSFVPYLYYVHSAFGKLLNVYSYQSVGFFDEGFKKGLFGFLGFRPTVIYYLLIHPYRGLFFYSPVLILAFPGWIMMIKRKKHIPDAILTFYIFSVFTIFFAGNFAWWGGWGYGPRYLVPIVAWLFIPIAFLVKESIGPARRAFWVLGIVSVLLHFTATAVDPNIAEGIDYEKAKNPKFIHNYPSPVLTWSYYAFKDGMLQPNLGTKLNLQRKYSLYPLYVFLALMLSLHYRKKDSINVQNPVERFFDERDEKSK